MRLPLLNDRSGPKRQGRKKLALLGLVVFVVSIGITLGVFFGIRAVEKDTAWETFSSNADDLTTALLAGVYDSQRNTRKIATQLRWEIQATGSLPTREWFNGAVNRLRADPSNGLGRLTFSPFISDAQRPRFEAAMSREAGRPVAIFDPATLRPANASAVYLPVLYSNTGQEPTTGPSYGLVGWSWSSWSLTIRDLIRRAASTGRVLTSEPTIYLPEHAGYVFSFTPIFITFQEYAFWFQNASGAPFVPILYCSGGPCPADYTRDPPDPRADFVINGRPAVLPLYGILKNNTNDQKQETELVPLCFPATPFDPAQLEYGTYDRTTPDPELTTPCQITRRQQEMQVQASQFLLETNPAIYLGALTSAVSPGQFITGVLASNKNTKNFLVAAEEVSDSDVWPFTIRVRSSDSWIGSAPALAWEAQTRANNGTNPVPPLPPTTASGKGAVQTVRGADGKERRFQPSAFSPYTFIALDAPSFPTPGGRFGFAISGDWAARGITQPCQNVSLAPNPLAYVTICPPGMPLSQYLELTEHSKFRQSFVGLVGGRLWRLEVASVEPYYVDYSDSTDALIGGLVLSTFLACIVLTMLLARHQQERQRQQAAAEGAHKLVVDYCVSEVKHCNDGLVYQLAELQKSLPALAEADRQLRAEILTLSAAGRPAVLVGGADESKESSFEDDEEEALRIQFELQRARAHLLALHAIIGPALEQLASNVSVMEVSCEQLHEVSNDFSDYSKLRAGQFEIRHKLVNLRAVIGRAVEAASSGTGTGVALFISPSLPSHALVDPLRIQQVLVNGISNAAKFSRDITMSVKGLDEDNTADKLSLIPVPCWYNGNRPDFAALRSQIGKRLLSGYETQGTSTAVVREGERSGAVRRRKFFGRRSDPTDGRTGSLPAVLASQQSDGHGVDNDRSVQYLVFEIVHRVPLAQRQQQQEAEGTHGECQEPASSTTPQSRWRRFLARLSWRETTPSQRVSGEVELAPVPPQSSKSKSDSSGEASSSVHRPSASAASTASTVSHRSNVAQDSRPRRRFGTSSSGSRSTPVAGSARSSSLITGTSSDLALHGTSIGLALSSSLVERMGGYIALHEDDGAADRDDIIPSAPVVATRYSVVLPCWVKEKDELGGGEASAAHVESRRYSRARSASQSVVDVTGVRPSIASPISPRSPLPAPGGALSPTTNRELSLIETRNSGRLNLWRADSKSPLASAHPMAPSPMGFEAASIRDLSAAATPSLASRPSPAASPVASPETLAARASAAGPRVRASSTDRPSRPATVAHVLFADDDLVNRRLGRRMLERLHCTCDTIGDVALAASCFERTGQLERGPVRSPVPLGLMEPPRPYDFALFDIHCGGMLGWQACKEVKDRGLSGVPIYAMTGNTAPSDLHTYHDAGMEDLVLGKPFTVETLERVLEAALEQKRATQAQ